MTASIIPITGQETREECEQMAFEMIAVAHPVEAHAHDPERFWQFFHRERSHISREKMEAIFARYAKETE